MVLTERNSHDCAIRRRVQNRCNAFDRHDDRAADESHAVRVLAAEQ